MALLPLLLSAARIEQVSSARMKKLSAEESQAAEADLDALMDKYDNQDKPVKQKAQKQAASQSQAANGDAQPTKEMIQDYELKILSGNNMAENSARSGEDDVINEVLDKYTKKGKNDDEIIAKDDAQDACNDIYEKLRSVDSQTAIDKVKEKFSQLWAEHDVNNQTFLERSEMYALVQDITRI